MVSPSQESIVDIYRTHPNGLSLSRRLHFTFEQGEFSVLKIEEAQENRIVTKELDPDRIFNGTFRLSGAKHISQSDKGIPHLEIIREAESKHVQSNQIEIYDGEKDEEQSDEDDYDV